MTKPRPFAKAGTVPGSSMTSVHGRTFVAITPNEVLLTTLSSARLSSYLQASEDDLSAALDLYVWNSQASAAFLEVLGILEVVVRNAWHMSLEVMSINQGGDARWYENGSGFLNKFSMKDIEEATGRLMNRHKNLSSNRIVSELNFGFWRFLFAKQYRTTLWPLAGKHAFPNLEPSQIRELSHAMGQLHNLRNRIAHHEPIHRRNLEKDFSECLWIIGGVCQVTKAWVESNSRVTEVLRNRPFR